MSYTPNTWATGDTITAEKLNNMEQGIAGAGGGGDVFVVAFSMDETTGTFTASKTYAEVAAAIAGNKLVIGTAAGTPLYYNGTLGSYFEFVATVWMVGSNMVTCLSFLLKGDDSCEMRGQYTYTLTPAS